MSTVRAMYVMRCASSVILDMRSPAARISGRGDPPAMRSEESQKKDEGHFLNIIGVLNCKKTPDRCKFPYVVDKRLLVRFNRLLEKTGAKSRLCPPPGDTTLLGSLAPSTGGFRSST